MRSKLLFVWLKLKAKNEIDSGSLDFVSKAYRSGNSNGYSLMDDVGEEDEDLIGIHRIKPMNGIPTPPMRSKAKNPSRIVEYSDGFGDHNVSGNSSELFWVNSRSKGGVNSSGVMNGAKRGRGELEEIAASIKMLTKGYVKMERAKMEMAREMEETRMAMEMKRNEMLLESEKQKDNFRVNM